MKLTILIGSAAILLATIGIAEAKGPGQRPPGQMMKQHGSVPGHPGASGWAPGHMKRRPVVSKRRSRRY